ncbi:hypothetical protein E1258_03645 [Micromonospora sp. KC207]|uniref:hypothetical protein n=1 Tax=Micromonospora sp. KC207 TaxID=2530377 RepID=UPI00104E0D6A|nr:hypothetical protein [Micromonospora sp. KC207]TDC66074.1 hypothetical protein E1258_03645 [Micromonospora sp. KC207]
MQQPKIIAQASADIMPLYQHFGFRDWLEEPSIEETAALLATARDVVAACDGRQMIVSCGQSESLVRVICQFWDQRPPLSNELWQGVQDFRLACPSGEVFIDQPTMLAVDLSRYHKLEPGVVNVRMMWRGRRDPRESVAPNQLGSVTEIYNLQLW